jgi:ribose transport system substrate-binding protein
VKDALNTLPDARHIAVVCINDDTALGAIGAAEAAGRKKDLAVVAVDGSDRGRAEIVKPDTPMVGTTASFPEKYGEKIIPVMLKMMKGESVPKAFYTDHVFLTRENVKQYYP